MFEREQWKVGCCKRHTVADERGQVAGAEWMDTFMFFGRCVCVYFLLRPSPLLHTSPTQPSSSDPEELHVEVKRRPSRDDAPCAPLAIPQLGGDNHLPAFADSHAQDALRCIVM